MPVSSPFSRPRLAFAAAGLLAVGGIAGAVVAAEAQPRATMAPVVPVAIRSLSGSGIVSLRGQVAEVYGNKFILADPTGRALVDTGPAGDRQALVAPGQPVTVQGRFDHGFLHAAFLVGADRKVTALGPLAGPPPHGPGAPPPPPPGGAAPPPPPPPGAVPPPGAQPPAPALPAPAA